MSRKISDLQDPFREKAIMFEHACVEEGLQVLIYCTERNFEQQARLYRQGRSISEIELKATQLYQKYNRPDLASILMDAAPQKGKRIVTWAGPGQSLHGYGYAFDGCPTREGKPVWGTTDSEDFELWMQYGKIAKSFDLLWAGDWPKHQREFPHVQMKGINWRDLIKSGI